MTQAHICFPGLTYADLARELQRELAHRMNLFGKLVRKGSMTEGEAKRQLALIEALIADVARFEAAVTTWVPCEHGQRITNPLALPRGHGFSWHDRRAAILRELALRKRVYPDQIFRGSLTAEAAAAQTRALECLLALFEDGFDWQPANGVAPAFGSLAPSPEQEASRREWDAIETEVIARDKPAPPEQQQELI